MSQQENNDSADVLRIRANFTRLYRRIIQLRVIMPSANCNQAVASRRAKYVDNFRV
jgi:hypothetical protein